MTREQIPILDLCLKCGIKVYHISLWREEALVELYVGDKVEVTHLKGTIQPNGGGKLDSSNYTTVKIVERQILEAVLEIIGVSEYDNMIMLLDSEMEDYAVPSHFYMGNINRGVTIYRATIYRNTKMQQYVSWIVTICIVW